MAKRKISAAERQEAYRKASAILDDKRRSPTCRGKLWERYSRLINKAWGKGGAR